MQVARALVKRAPGRAPAPPSALPPSCRTLQPPSHPATKHARAPRHRRLPRQLAQQLLRHPHDVVFSIIRTRRWLFARTSPINALEDGVAGEDEPPLRHQGDDVVRRVGRADVDQLDAEVVDLPAALSYSLLDDPPAVRARYAPGVETVTVHPFRAEAAPGWEPVLDAEHDSYQWCNAEDAVQLLGYETLREAVRAAERAVTS